MIVNDDIKQMIHKGMIFNTIATDYEGIIDDLATWSSDTFETEIYYEETMPCIIPKDVYDSLKGEPLKRLRQEYANSFGQKIDRSLMLKVLSNAMYHKTIDSTTISVEDIENEINNAVESIADPIGIIVDHRLIRTLFYMKNFDFIYPPEIVNLPNHNIIGCWGEDNIPIIISSMKIDVGRFTQPIIAVIGNESLGYVIQNLFVSTDEYSNYLDYVKTNDILFNLSFSSDDVVLKLSMDYAVKALNNNMAALHVLV